MTEAVVYEQFDQEAQPVGGVGGNASDLRRLSDVPMELSVEIGSTRMTVGETLQLRAGSIVTLDRLAGEPVDLLVNGTPIARGEVVVVDEQFGLRVTQIVEGDPAAATAGRGHPATPDRAADGPDDPSPSDPSPPDSPAPDSPAQD
jgi:flagellar motor switch protein FliN